MLHYDYYQKPNKGNSLRQRNYLDDSPELAPQEAALTAAKGIGPNAAKSLLEASETINDLCLWDDDEIAQIDGIGPNRAREIYKLLHHGVVK